MNYIKELDKVLDATPKALLEHEDIEIWVTYEIYNNIKPFLKDDKYKGYKVVIKGLAPKTIIITPKSKYHK